MRRLKVLVGAVPALLASLLCGNALAAIDLRNASVERLDNGLTVILLEDRNFPVVSVQTLYRVGARDESFGQTGIAHFLEHMAFRDSSNFPDTGLVSSIYAVGGEWHGYTWTDQTTYFATVPKEHLDLLLRIEADRMSRLRISKDDMEAERGAVLAEMHMYENYPTSMLLDAVMFASFFAHPYRNNTIGWESDIENLQHEEVVSFYEMHYRPANAVLAIAGDFDSGEVRARIDELFDDLKGGAATPMPHTVEPIQEGERRVRLYGNTDVKRAMIGYRAPSANHEDFAAFLVLQEVLGTGSGVNFRQNDWGTPIGDDAVLKGLADELTTWYPPSAQDYIFIVGAVIAADDEEERLERSLEERLSGVRRHPPADPALNGAIERVLDELVYDVETTEDAAHQLAFFDGLHALDTFLELPQRVAQVSAADVQRVAQSWLLPERRTIAWHVPDERPERPAIETAGPVPEIVKSEPATPIDADPVPLPEVRRLSGGMPVIVQQSDVSRSAYLLVVFPGSTVVADAVSANDPVSGHSSVAYRLRPDELQKTVNIAERAVRMATVAKSGTGEPGSDDPETRLEEVFTALMSGEEEARQSQVSPVLIVASGDMDTEQAFAALENSFGNVGAAKHGEVRRGSLPHKDIEVHLGKPVAQAQLGYVVPAPAPIEDRSFHYRLLLYILSHEYAGRLGKEAISNRGLAYYIDSRYRSDGTNAWITLAVGVDPAKVADLKALIHAELQRLREDPPTIEEVEDAKRHFAGRARSASQSNRELSAALAENWLWYGELLSAESVERKLDRISREDILNAVPAFIDGVTVTVDR